MKLDNNRITLIEPRSFTNLPLLKTLDLSKNAIGVILKDTFRFLHYADRILLSNNRLTMIKKDMFTGIGGTVEWKVRLGGKHTTCQRGVAVLDMLDLSSNLIGLEVNGKKNVGIEDEAFHHVGEINTLDLSRNRIPVFSAKAFNSKYMHIIGDTGIQIKRRLDLSCNAIAAVEGTIDGAMQSLPTLDLRNNQLTEINPLLFEHGDALHTLSLGANKICFRTGPRARTCVCVCGAFVPARARHPPVLRAVSCLDAKDTTVHPSKRGRT